MVIEYLKKIVIRNEQRKIEKANKEILKKRKEIIFKLDK